MNTIRIGTVEFTPEEVERLYNAGRRYIITYGTIWQIVKTKKRPRLHGKAIYKAKGLTRRGRFYAWSAEEMRHYYPEALA